MTLNKDQWGAITAVVCLIHCAAVPVLLAMGLTVTGGMFFGNEKVHVLLLIPVVFLAALSLPSGFKEHKNPVPFLLGLFGLVLMFLGLAFEAAELYLTVTASLLLITAHLLNQKYLKPKVK